MRETLGRIKQISQEKVLEGHGDCAYIKVEDRFGINNFIFEDLGDKEMDFSNFEESLEEAYKENNGIPVHVSVIFSHLHQDHIGGLDEFIEKYKNDERIVIDNFYLPKGFSLSLEYIELLNKTSEERIQLFSNSSKEEIIEMFSWCQMYSKLRDKEGTLAKMVEQDLKEYNKTIFDSKNKITSKNIQTEVSNIRNDFKQDLHEKGSELAKKKDSKMTDKEELELDRHIDALLNTASKMKKYDLHFYGVNEKDIEKTIYDVNVKFHLFNKDKWAENVRNLCHTGKLKESLFLHRRNEEYDYDENGVILNTKDNRERMMGKQAYKYIDNARKRFNETHPNSKKQPWQNENANDIADLLIRYAYAGNENMSNIVSKIDDGRFSALFTGDMEMFDELMLVSNKKFDLSADYIKIAHHGSWTSSCPLYLTYALDSSFEKGIYPFFAVSGGEKDRASYSLEHCDEFSLDKKVEMYDMPCDYTYRCAGIKDRKTPDAIKSITLKIDERGDIYIVSPLAKDKIYEVSKEKKYTIDKYEDALKQGLNLDDLLSTFYKDVEKIKEQTYSR